MSIDRERLSEERDFHEETAAELSPRLKAPLDQRKHEDIDGIVDRSVQEVQEGAGNGTAVGVTGLVLSLASLFTLPFLLSLLGIGAGFFAYQKGARSLGRWSIGIGIVSMIGAMMFAPFVG